MALKAIPTKKFLVTYTMTVYVEAETEEQAKKTIESVDRETLSDESSFESILEIRKVKS